VLNVNSTAVDRDPSLSASGLELFFASTRVGANLGDIYVATRGSVGAPFGAATPIMVLNTGNNELAPDPTGDGLELFFDRVGTGVMVSKRASAAAAWGSPMFTGVVGRFPSISADGLTLFVTKPSGACTDSCLMVSTRPDRNSAFSAPVEFAIPGDLNYNDCDISSDGLQLLVSGPPMVGQARILLLTRPDVGSAWLTADTIPSLSFFSSNSAAAWGLNDLEIYLNAVDSQAGVGMDDIYVSVFE
jgi:hypothetical protein